MKNTSQTQTPTTGGLRGLHAYQVSLEFYRQLTAALQTAARSHVTNQVTRASESVVLNIGEAYPATGNDRARRVRIAADEASECRVALDLLEIRKALPEHTIKELRALNDRQCAMLFRLSRRR